MTARRAASLVVDALSDPWIHLILVALAVFGLAALVRPAD